jgi:cellulose biosynthesis protein BcsQ
MPVAADYEHVVVDTPPGELSIACGALMAAEVALVAVPPTPIDLDRVMPTLELVADVEDVTGVGFFLRDFAYDNDGMRVVRALLLELRDDPGLASRVLSRTGEL